jgi:hypothetical protein
VTPGVRSLPGSVRRLHLLQGGAVFFTLRARHSWELAHDRPHRAVLAAALDRLNRLALPEPDALLDQYAEALSRFAPREVEPITSETHRATAIEHLVIATLLYEPLLATMRRMAHESESAHR